MRLCPNENIDSVFKTKLCSYSAPFEELLVLKGFLILKREQRLSHPSKPNLFYRVVFVFFWTFRMIYQSSWNMPFGRHHFRREAGSCPALGDGNIHMFDQKHESNTNSIWILIYVLDFLLQRRRLVFSFINTPTLKYQYWQPHTWF